MISKNEVKHIKSLNQKKYRNRSGQFLVEGKKMILDLLEKQLIPDYLLTSVKEERSFKVPVSLISESDMRKVSPVKSPSGYLAVFPQLSQNQNISTNGISLYLDGVRDPGNFGTIIRLASWFGVKQILCSEDTVDLYNPKVIQATMGAFTGLSIHYGEIKNLLNPFIERNIPIVGTFMEGNPLSQTDFPDDFLLVMGSEGSGITEEVAKLCSKKISINRIGGSAAESLNVSMATAICLGHFFKHQV